MDKQTLQANFIYNLAIWLIVSLVVMLAAFTKYYQLFVPMMSVWAVLAVGLIMLSLYRLNKFMDAVQDYRYLAIDASNVSLGAEGRYIKLGIKKLDTKHINSTKK